MGKVSLYVPCYNVGKYIAQCIDAVLKQTYPIDEILIIDDGSIDNTVEIVSKYPVRIIRHKENRGLAAARNTAFKNAKNDFVASLDADCLSELDWLEKLMQNFSNGNIAGVCGKLFEKYTDTIADKWRAVHMRQHWGEERIVNPTFLFGSSNVFRKNVVMRVGFYNEKYRTNYEDVDLSKRLLARNYKLIYEPQAIAYHLRKDTILSVLRAHWNWNLYLGKRMPVNFHNFMRRIYGNLRWSRRFLITDFLRGRFSLLSINLFLFFHHSFCDLRYYLLPGSRNGK